MGCPTQVEVGDNLVFTITTHAADTGAATDADSAPAYRVYEDETGTAILTGTMTKLDDANTTGLYSESIACTGGNGFEEGKTYTVYIEATVGGVTGAVAYGFKAVDDEAVRDAIAANVASILTDTAEIGAAGAGLTAIPWNAAWDAEVQSECADALTAWGKTGFSLAATGLDLVIPADPAAVPTLGTTHIVGCVAFILNAIVSSSTYDEADGSEVMKNQAGADIASGTWDYTGGVTTKPELA